MSQPTQDEFAQALAAAGNAHHDYEQNFLGGERDEQWPGFYAAYALGRLGNFVAPSSLSGWLQEVPAGDDWPKTTAAYVLQRMTP